ncbi:MAG: tetratricopeptide repeat protein [Sulfuricella sp.]|nr:tetratricopeptide repeat protein [Sulfuricella sp.]
MFKFLGQIFTSVRKNSPGPISVTGTSDQILPGQFDAPGRSLAYKKQGNEYLAQGDLPNAAECYRKAIEVSPDYAEGFINLGFVLKEQKLYEDAECSLRRAILLCPESEDAYYLLATVLRELGNLDEAVINYSNAIRLKPDFEMAYDDMSRALFESGRVEEAKSLLVTAIGFSPGNADFHYHLGKLFVSDGDINRAIDCFAKTLTIQPEFAEAHHDMGLALQTDKKLDLAVESYRRALSLKPDYAEAYGNLGFALQRKGQLDEALENYQKALAIKPNFAAVHNNLASVLQAQNRLEQAVEHLRQALAINPAYVEAHSNLAVALRMQGNLEGAIQSCEKALSINPNCAQAYSRLADVFQAQGKLDVAVENYRRALALEPDFAETHYNLGNALKAQGNLDAAIDRYQQAILLNPDFADAHHNLALVYTEKGMLQESIRCFQDAISVSPDFVNAHLNMSLSQLLMGSLEQGWAEYEWRWQSDHMQAIKYNYKQPLWLGKESLRGKTILLHHEQGFGDTIQFCRYAKLVAGLEATVLLLVPKPLKSLMTELEGASQVLAEGETLPKFDYHCPLMSLPLAFSTGLNTIPVEDSYLRYGPDHASKWAEKLGNKTQPRVGLVWSGSQTHKNDHNRSIPLNEVTAFLSDGVQFVSLQKEVRPLDQRVLEDTKNIAYFGRELHSFADTAGLIANMDLVISVDTSVAHLAAALGKTVWLLLPFNPDWRWMLGRTDSPWYPSMKLFRQKEIGDWNSVLSMAAQDLKQHDFRSVAPD